MIPVHYAVAAILLGAASPTAPTWFEQSVAALTCTALADDQERLSLRAPPTPSFRDSAAVRRYFVSPLPPGHAARYRHLLLLGALDHWAAVVDDPALRSDLLAHTSIIAQRAAGQPSAPLVFEQISRCALGKLVGVTLELGRAGAADTLARQMAARYSPDRRDLPVTDWPLLLALREAALHTGHPAPAAHLAAAALRQYSSPPASTADSTRMARTLGRVAASLTPWRSSEELRQLAALALSWSPKPIPLGLRWQLTPALVGRERDNPAAVRTWIGALIAADPSMASSNDRRGVIDALALLAEAYDQMPQPDSASTYRLAAFRELLDLSHLDFSTGRFTRHVTAMLSEDPDTSFAWLARRDRAWGEEVAIEYGDRWQELANQASTDFVADSRTRTIQRFKQNGNFDALVQLWQPVETARAAIEDGLFRLFQLRGFGRLSLATVVGPVHHATMSSTARADVERFFTQATQPSAWLEILFRRIAGGTQAALPSPEDAWLTFFALDVWYTERHSALPRYIEFVSSAVPALKEHLNPIPVALADVRPHLPPGEAVVLTAVAPRATYVMAFTRDDLLVHRVAIDADSLQRLVHELRSSLAPSSEGGRTVFRPFNAGVSYELWDRLLAPLGRVIHGASTVHWFGDDVLGVLPVASLVIERPANTMSTTYEEHRALAFLVDRVAVTVLPDLGRASIRSLTGKTPMRQSRAFLGIGAPLLDAVELEGHRAARSMDLAGGLSPADLREMPKLPEAVSELRAIANLLAPAPSTLMVGPAAREDSLRRLDLTGYGILAFATHGFAPGEVDGSREPVLLLRLPDEEPRDGDGLLTMSEVARLRLDADVVILSACNTAASDGRPGTEGLSGLAQAFFTAGARAVLVSHWPVVSGAAAQLTTAFVEEYTLRGNGLAVALRVAALKTRGSATTAEEAHPGYWNPFTVASTAPN